MRIILFTLGLIVSQSLFARTGLLVDPKGAWATIIVDTKISPWGGEELCRGPEALRLFDALKLRPELGADAVVRSYRDNQIQIKCEYVRGFDFVNCSIKLFASEFVDIDPSNERVSAKWTGAQAKVLHKLWDKSCAGPHFVSEDSRLRLDWSDRESVELDFSSQATVSAR